MDRLRNKQPLLIHGTGEQRRDLVYVADVVSAILAMLRNEHLGTWNVGTGLSTSVLDLLSTLEEQIEPAVEVKHGPPRPGDVVDSRLSVDLIAKELAWRPEYDLAEGIADTLRRQ
jgi:UDP-glucose 4-epimerase